jgi:hypothetical protein
LNFIEPHGFSPRFYAGVLFYITCTLMGCPTHLFPRH